LIISNNYAGPLFIVSIILKIVFWNRVYSFVNFKNCFGNFSLDCGHNLEPDPPHKIVKLYIKRKANFFL
jgi:hypothetical protein